MRQSKLEVEIDLQIPNDLKSVWAKAQWNESNNVFTLYNFKPFFLIDPINEEDIIRYSKYLDGNLISSNFSVKRSLVFAKSFLDDDGQLLFYGFDEDGRDIGIFAWHLDNGPQFPSKISKDLAEIFESNKSMADGFDNAKTISETWIKATHGKLKQSDFVYGNFPRKDLKEIAEGICPDLIYFPNEISFLVDKEKLIEIDSFYSNLGRSGLLNEMKDKHLTEFLKKVNMEPFNQNMAKKAFVIQFFNSPTYAICNCNKQQAKELNRYGYFSFYNLKDSEEGSRFINE